MAIDKHHPHKSPSQNPVDFYKGKVHGGKHGAPSNVPEQLSGGPMKEKITGKKGL
jgi:hypothetical protein